MSLFGLAQSKLRYLLLATASICLSANSASADLEWAGLESVEWLTDTSDLIFVGQQRETNVVVIALLKTTQAARAAFSPGREFTTNHLTAFGPNTLFDAAESRRQLNPDEVAIYFMRKDRSGRFHVAKRQSLQTPLVLITQAERVEFFGVDRHGVPLKSGVKLLSVVRERIRHGSIVPYQFPRDYGEGPPGPRWTTSGALSLGDYTFDVRVPAYPE